MSEGTHLDAFLAGLPRLAIQSVPNETPIPRIRSVKPLILYNGFDGFQRMRTWEVAKWLMALGAMPRPAICDLCRGGAEQYHAENYFDFGSYISICRSCHAKVHNRLRNFDTWQKRRAELDLPASHWANGLKANDFPVALWCRHIGIREPTFADFVAKG